MMNSTEETNKQQHLDQIGRKLAERLGSDGNAVEAEFARQFFGRVPVEELSATDPSTHAAVVANYFEFMRQRMPGQVLFRIYNPVAEEDGWETSHTVIEIVNDDMPFLVDTVVLALSELGISAHLIVHPVVRVRRDAGGHFLSLAGSDDESVNAESLMHLLIDRQTYPEVLARIEKRITAALAGVRKAVGDYHPMRDKALEIAESLPDSSPGMDEHARQEARDFFEWLARDHFTFLGYREYEIVKEKGQRVLRVIEGSGLGIMREDARTTRSRPVGSLSGSVPGTRDETGPIIITKTNARSNIHRGGYMDYISVLRHDGKGTVIGEKRLIGLFTSGAYIRRCVDTPLVRRKVEEVVEKSGLRPGSHAGKALLHIMETLPRDELFQASSDELLELAIGILDLQERSQTRLFIRRERFGRFFSCLVFIPRDRFNTENREHIQAILKRALKGERLDFAVQVGESKLARMHVIIRPKAGAAPEYDIGEIENRIKKAVRSWHDELSEILTREHGEEQGLELARRIGRAFPMSYIEDVSPHVASYDVVNAASLKDMGDLRMSLYKPRQRKVGLVRFKLFKYGRPIPLSEVLPMLENLGLKVVSERPYELKLEDGNKLWIQDFDMEPAARQTPNLDQIREHFQAAFEQAWRLGIENDGFNRLVMAARVGWRQAAVLRAYGKYLLQTGMPYSQAYMEQTLEAWPLAARLLVELFESRFDPARANESKQQRQAAGKALSVQCCEQSEGIDDPVLKEFLEEVCAGRAAGDSDAQQKLAKRAILRTLESVSSADQDRILRSFTNLILATLRTNIYRVDHRKQPREFFSFKLDSQRVPDLPQPRPYREIWVYSPRVEGIHLRMGKVARGGLRWSDRREDFRTEVLGLMMAQQVKNTMIVPVGAKGGFVVKRPPEGDDRDALMAEVVHCYRCFIHGLLDITDNLKGEDLVPPPDVVRQDEDDPYLVVAADKGTATFSDIANAVAAEHGFWLDDAFASGGSNGYDHKKMGITAKGAWESVKRHFRELGTDIQNEDFTVVGIGDMAGDVFGNGMLLSRHIRLKAAFNHMHIFLDPDPDAKSYTERERLFNLPRSSWADYDEKLISKGGGVYSRQAKTIPISEEVREWLGIEEERLAPFELIRELLKAPVDLLWNGGIGTYVKSERESNSDVGDLANNPVRIDGRELRCKVVGEGGNLGFTRRGRIEYALHGGRLNTDFIDNSAGVDCSDHEVNIKILLNQVVADGELDGERRNVLLKNMTDEVEELVLRSNYLQTQALSMMESMTSTRLGAEAHFISVLEQRGVLDRDLEALPDEDELRERIAQGKGLTRPELALLFSFSKILLYQDLLESDVPEDPYLSAELEDYFPKVLTENYRDYMRDHRLRREIIATRVTNSMVNRMGAYFAMRITEDTGASPAAAAKAYTVAREILEARRYWRAIESLDNKVPAALQTEALLEIWNLVRQVTRRLITLPGGYAIDISSKVNRLKPGIQAYRDCLLDVLGGEEQAALTARANELEQAGFPIDLARELAGLRFMYSSLDVVDEALASKLEVRQVAAVHFQLLERLNLKWLRNQVEALPVTGQWHAHARGNLRDELFGQHRALTRRVLAGLESGDPGSKPAPNIDPGSGTSADPIGQWFAGHRAEIERSRMMLDEMRNLGEGDYATLLVAIHGLRQLVHST